MSQKRLKKIRKQDKILNFPKEEKNVNFMFWKTIKENWKFLFFLTLGIFSLYFNSLKGDFVSDDYATIPQNPMVMDFSYMAKGSFVSLSNWLLAKIFGIVNVVPYHFFNLAMYVFICIFAFILIYLLLNKNIAILSTILFAISPIHVESISWISGKPYLFSAFFVLLSLIFFVLYFKTNNKKYLWILLTLLPLTFLAEKVRSISFILLAILIFWVYKNDFRVKVRWSRLLFLLISGIILISIVIWPLILGRIGAVNTDYNKTNSIFYDPFFQYPTAIAKYLQLLLFPMDLTLYHTMFVFPIWLNWIIFLLYLSITVFSFFKNKNVFFCMAFIFLATAPSMAPVKVSWLVAERYMFLGSLGLCVLLSLIFQDLFKKSKIIGLIIIIAITFFYSVKVIIRNNDWKTNHNLWIKTVQVSPNSHNAWNNIGDDYDKLKQYENSIKGFSQSTVVKPDYADAYHNRANIFIKIGRLDLARQSYETALKFSPGLYQTYISLIQMDLYEKKNDLAVEHAKKMIELQPDNPQSYYILGVVDLQIGKNDEAKNIFKSLVSKYPDFKQAKEILLKLQ